MAQRKAFDRFAQMEKQQELIAKKRQEILEKQRTAELAKQVAASMKEKNSDATPTVVTKSLTDKQKEKLTENLDVNEKEAVSATTSNAITTATTLNQRNSLLGKTGKINFGLKRAQPAPVQELSPPKAKNTFCNDGSFLDHFKKILESQKPKVVAPVEVTAPIVEAEAESEQTELEEVCSLPPPPPMPIQLQAQSQSAHATPQQQSALVSPPPQSSHVPPPPPVSVAVPVPTPQTFAFNPNFLHSQGMLITQQQPQEQTSMPAAFFSAHFANFTPPQLPPPPPPPQLPISLANLAPLYMIPAPEPIQISAIQAPKEFDLNAIPKPQLNLEAIQVPATQSEQFSMMTSNSNMNIQTSNNATQQQLQLMQHAEGEEQHQQRQRQQQQPQQNPLDNDNHKCLQLPTTVDSLIALVAENGDEFEDKIRTQNDQLHPAMWFLFDKQCQQYQQYRQRLNNELQRRMQQEPQHQQQEQYDTDDNDDFQDHYGQQQQQQQAGEKYDPESAFGGDIDDSDEEYMQDMQNRNRENLEQRVLERNEQQQQQLGGDNGSEIDTMAEQKAKQRKKQRRSRWGDKVEDGGISSSEVYSSASTSFGNQNKPMLTSITRSDPGLLQYARLNYGSTNLSEDDWKKCEEHYKVNLLYQDMIRKREEIDRLARSGKFKYEYDSDEDVDGGTWEHKLRTAEMEATRAWASALTKQSEGKHHIGDFLPPEELKKFMEQYEAQKNNRQPDLSDYKEYKLREDNIGFQMLQKLGWKEGQGLGQDGAGIVDPVNKGPQRDGNVGLGVAGVAPEECDNEYDAYRKRMMLAYRFRPNPLNNPRRAYY